MEILYHGFVIVFCLITVGLVLFVDHKFPGRLDKFHTVAYYAVLLLGGFLVTTHLTQLVQLLKG